MQVLSIGRKKRIYAIAFSPDGWELAAACGDYQLRIWDLRTGKVRQALHVNRTWSGYDLAYLDADRLIFAGDQLGWWDLPTGVWNMIAPLRRVNSRLRLSPDRRVLAEVDQMTSTEMGCTGLLLYDTTTWKELPTPADAGQTTGGLAFSPDGQKLATGHTVQVGNRQRSVIGMAFAVPDYDYEVRVHDLATGQVVQSLEAGNRGSAISSFLTPERCSWARRGRGYASGTWRATGSLPCTSGAPSTSRAWLSPLMAATWPASVTTRRCGCGRPAPGRSTAPTPGRLAGCSTSPWPPTAAAPPPAATRGRW